MTLDVIARDNGTEIASTWALNEVTVEKAARERMVEVVIEVDGRPLSRWGCDGVVCATPTGSTAYAFSAGGPVVWPEVEALLMVPIAAHALFARPLVVSPALGPRRGAGARGRRRAADGRRPAPSRPDTSRRGPSGAVCGATGAAGSTCRPAPGSRCAAARCRCCSPGCTGWRAAGGGEFTDRLVAKFGLPVAGWRGRRRARVRVPNTASAAAHMTLMQTFKRTAGGDQCGGDGMTRRRSVGGGRYVSLTGPRAAGGGTAHPGRPRR